METIKGAPIKNTYVRVCDLLSCTGDEMTIYKLLESITYDTTSSFGTVVNVLAVTDNPKTAKLWAISTNSSTN